MSSTLRFLLQYLRPDPRSVTLREIQFERAAELLPASVYAPAGQRRPLPGWVLLHGLTVTGRQHAALDRFARALSASGTVVLVPEIPEWRRLQPAPAASQETIRAAVRTLGELGDVTSGRTGLLGFSFGSTQALMVAADPAVAAQLRGVAAWGGYCSLPNLCRFGVTGEHELDGEAFSIRPDAYGRWLLLGHYFTSIPGHEGHHRVAQALRDLALEAGRSGLYSDDPGLDPYKEQLARSLTGEERELFRLAAPPGGAPVPDPEFGRALALELARAALRIDPLLDPGPRLPEIRLPTVLAHGRHDRLIPFTESVRLARAVGPACPRGTVITGLFAHSKGSETPPGPWDRVREIATFVTLLRRLLAVP
jgi:pimeloyl-ACP methyl ester carboxylesterase